MARAHESATRRTWGLEVGAVTALPHPDAASPSLSRPRVHAAELLWEKSSRAGVQVAAHTVTKLFLKGGALS